MPKKIEYSYETFAKDIKTLAGKIKRSGIEFDHIVALSRGGLIPGVVLSHKLNVRMVPISWSLRDFEDREVNAWIPELIHLGHNILVVDDIIDSGRCLTTLLDDWRESMGSSFSTDSLYIASLIYNVDQSIIPNFYAKKISRKKVPEWYDFWWEKK